MSETFTSTDTRAASAGEFDRIDTYPPPYPEGWYVAARDRDVGKTPTKVRVAGNDDVLFRGPLEQHVRFRWWSEKRVPRLLASYVVGNWVTQWRQDIPIWESKIYQPRPLLMASDGPVMKLRRWYSQFYPQNAESND